MFIRVFVCFQGNVGPAAFWLLGYLLTNHKALMAVKREFSQITQMEPSETPLTDRAVHTPVFGESSIPACVNRGTLLVVCCLYCPQNNLQTKA